MPEKTDEAIKKKHKEFDQRIRSLLEELRGKPKGQSLRDRLRLAMGKIKGEA